jgi:phospholipid/cholesterol/gamma-HCH transport system ATP-binding protein
MDCKAGSSIVEVVNVSKKFGSTTILDRISLTVEQGRTNILIGRSGCGKSVLLKHMIGLLAPDEGEIYVEGENITAMSAREFNEVRKKFGMLFQNSALFDSMNVRENVAFPLREHTKKPLSEIYDIVEEKLRQVGLIDISDKSPSELSGGMRKRVGLARAIVMEPKVVLYDEPTTGLDPLTTDAINNLIQKMNVELKLTNFIITHDMAAALKIGHKISMLFGGKIIASGNPDEIRNSDNPYVQQFLSGSEIGPIGLTDK